MRQLALLGVCLLFSATTWAQNVDYNYVQGGYQRLKLDVPGSVDGDAFGVGGSVAVGDRWHIVANYSTADFDFGFDLNQFVIGAGYHTGISPRTDLFAELLYGQADASGFGVSADDSGIGASVGVRSMVSPVLEVFGSITHVDLGDGADGTSIGAGLWYTVSGNLAAGFSANFDEDVTGFGIGLRLYFDQY